MEVGVGADVERCEVEEEVAGDDVAKGGEGECASGCVAEGRLAVVVCWVAGVPVWQADGYHEGQDPGYPAPKSRGVGFFPDLRLVLVIFRLDAWSRTYFSDDMDTLKVSPRILQCEQHKTP